MQYNHLSNEDLKFVANSIKDSFPCISGKKIILTGVTGFFGKWIVETLNYLNTYEKLNIYSYVFVRNEQKFNLLFSNIDRNFFQVIKHNILDPANYSIKADYLIHMATTSAYETFEGVSDDSKIITLEVGTRNILTQAKKSSVKKILFTSSGVVYGSNQNHPNENQDILIPDEKNGLAIGKIGAEKQIIDFSHENNIQYSIARCFSFYGPYLPINIHYAIGNFINNCLNNENIVINGDGKPLRSYLYIAEAISWLFIIMLKGNNQIYNIGSDLDISIKDLAKLVSKFFSNKIDIDIRSKHSIEGNFDRNIYVPCIDKIKNNFLLDIEIDLECGIGKMINSLRKN